MIFLRLFLHMYPETYFQTKPLLQKKLSQMTMFVFQQIRFYLMPTNSAILSSRLFEKISQFFHFIYCMWEI